MRARSYQIILLPAVGVLADTLPHKASPGWKGHADNNSGNVGHEDQTEFQNENLCDAVKGKEVVGEQTWRR
jgi:hypothetical protein